MSVNHLESNLRPYGLHLRGLLKMTDEEIRSLQLDAGEGVSVALVGNIGSSYWPEFVKSAEFQDGEKNPLDRWSQRIGGQLADELGVKVIYPFEGPPYHPFQQWAGRAESLKQSAMGLMIHPKYGLWHSYRFGLLVPGSGVPGYQPDAQPSPCESCISRACLNTCPVGAFDSNGYHVNICAAYLKKTPGARCHSEGCLARLSCPVGSKYRYNSAEHRFHLNAFLASIQPFL